MHRPHRDHWPAAPDFPTLARFGEAEIVEDLAGQLHLRGGALLTTSVGDQIVNSKLTAVALAMSAFVLATRRRAPALRHGEHAAFPGIPG